MKTPPPGMDADSFCLWLKRQIALEGADAVFGHCGFLVLYSGPIEKFKIELERLLDRSVKNNKERGSKQATRLGTNILDDTPIGKWIDDRQLDAYFRAFYGRDAAKINAAIFQVWAEVSKELIRTAFGRAVTNVCGADPSRVFRRAELPQLLRETKLDTINGLPVKLIRDFSKMSIVEAYRQICKYELLNLHYKAKQATDPVESVKLRTEWREHWNFYKQKLAKDRKGRKPQDPARTAALRSRRKRIRAGLDFSAIKRAIVEFNAPAP